ncbi:MAG: hypothetical protein ACRCZF_04835, partial [Gemmataceae bacterium]
AAHLFSAEGIEKSKKSLADTSFKSTTHVTVLTFAKVPDSKKAAFEAAEKSDADRSKFFYNWAVDEGKNRKETGIVVLICNGGGKQNKIEIVVDRASDVSRDFTTANTQELVNIFKAGMKAGADAAKDGKSADEVKQIHDAALVKVAGFVIKELQYTSAPEGKTKTASNTSSGTSPSAEAAPNGGGGIGGFSMGGLICMGLCVMLGIWVVIALVRSLFGGGGGGGYGYGGGGGMMGGGGGFFGTFLGGMFGAAAGMYLYDSFFGGHNHSSYGNDAAASTGADGTSTDAGAGDFEGGNSAGSDYDSGGAGDYGGGGDWGGDSGGGGDYGGGGDWGGGGDGGGGGGDW